MCHVFIHLSTKHKENAKWCPKLLMIKAFALYKSACKTDRNTVFYHHLLLPGPSGNVSLFLTAELSLKT